jgi:hypothetical protein
MTETKTTGQAAIILYGRSAIGKPRAGLFEGTDVEPARKAASKLGLLIADLSAELASSLGAKVPPGRLAANGDKIVPFVKQDVFDKIQAAIIAAPKESSKVSVGAVKTSVKPAGRLPDSWDDIKVGDVVLAQDTDPADGWWQVTVVESRGDVFKLRWPRSERGRPIVRHRLALALICPGQNKGGPLPEAKKAAAQSDSVYPRTWSGIGLGHVVLAKEDGPAEQWWEAKTIAKDKESFTLEWRDHTALPTIMRPRLLLGLVHPAPKTR